jgi:hypothetical protein
MFDPVLGEGRRARDRLAEPAGADQREGLVASTISAPLTALASEDAARFVLGLSSNCPLCNSLSPLLFSTTKRNFSPLLRISIFPAIIVLLVATGIRVYVAQSQEGSGGRRRIAIAQPNG